MTRSTLSLRNTTNPSSVPRRNLRLKNPWLCHILSCALLVGLGACQPTYPEKTLTSSLTRLAKDEEATDIACRIVGETLWVYIPLSNLIDEIKVTWNTEGIEKMNKILGLAHRVVLSTDAKIDFLAILAADTQKFGVELLALEYIPDLRQAILEKFSRGEFFMRSVREVAFNPEGTAGMSPNVISKFYDISFSKFLALQIIHRVKNLFVKDKTLNRLFELRSSAAGDQDGIIKVELEFLRRRYDTTAADPLDSVKMIAALVVKNYEYHDFQTLELTDTFAKKTLKLTPLDLKEIKIDLPDFSE